MKTPVGESWRGFFLCTTLARCPALRSLARRPRRSAQAAARNSGRTSFAVERSHLQVLALALNVLSDDSLSPDRVARVDIGAALPALIVALGSDLRTGELAAQAIGNLGAAGAAAVPALVKLLSSDEEGLRNSACIGLRGIGPSAKSAVPQLTVTLADPSSNVRGFARLAIGKIDGSVPNFTVPAPRTCR